MKEESNIAAVEFKSVSRGMMVTDEMLKAARVNLILATPLCPGKYLTIVEGDVPSVQRAAETADLIGERHVFSSFVITALNTEIIEALGGKRSEDLGESMGILESFQMSNLLSAADISLDSAEVKISQFRLGRGCGVNSFYIVTGKLAAVEEATRNASVFLGELGSLIAEKVIANPDRDLLRWLEPAMCSMC